MGPLQDILPVVSVFLCPRSMQDLIKSVRVETQKYVMSFVDHSRVVWDSESWKPSFEGLSALPV